MKEIDNFKKLLIATVLSSSVGCGMTNEEIVKEVDICEKAGLVPSQTVNMLTYSVVSVTCHIPKDHKAD